MSRSTYAKVDRNRTLSTDKPDHRSRARAETRWLNEDHLDSGIFTPQTMRPSDPPTRINELPQVTTHEADSYLSERPKETHDSVGGSRNEYDNQESVYDQRHVRAISSAPRLANYGANQTGHPGRQGDHD